MSKVLILNGSPRVNGNTSIAIREMENVFRNSGVEVTTIQIGNKDIRGCIACNQCSEIGKFPWQTTYGLHPAKLENVCLMIS